MSRRVKLAGLLSPFLLIGLVALGRKEEGDETAEAAPDFALRTLATGLAAPTSATHAGDTRLFLTLQRGQIVIYDGTLVLAAPFLDITPLVSCCGERGLLSAAFHPRYAQNGLFFVNYTNTAGDTVVARYRVSSASRDAADPASGVILFTIRQPFANHNGGQLQFGPDGYLYIGMGDGGSANDPMCNAQRADSLLGKMLRIDVDQSADAPPYYGIPADNPFAGPGNPPDEVWASGLRNPWRFSFDRATGDLWIGDVGQGAREEIDFQPRASRGGENYGWKMMEGTICGGGGTSGCPAGVFPCNAPGLIAPVFEYSHGSGDCSVTGGYVYRGPRIPQLAGVYVYGDYCTGRIWGGAQLLTARAPRLTSFGEDIEGELYLVTEDGNLFRAVHPDPPPVSVPRMTPAPRVPRPAPRVIPRSAS